MEEVQQLCHGSAPVGDGIFVCGRHLCKSNVPALRVENRVITKTTFAFEFGADLSLHNALKVVLLIESHECDDSAEAGAAVVFIPQFAQEEIDIVLIGALRPGIAGGVDAGFSTQSGYFQPGVVSKAGNAIVFQHIARLLKSIALQGVLSLGQFLFAAYVPKASDLHAIGHHLADFFEFIGVVGSKANAGHRAVG